MSHEDLELSNWHDWTNPDFFLTERHRESNIITLFLRQILPGRLFRTKMTLTGWCLVTVSIGLGVAAYNTTSNILFLALSLLLSSLILSGILSLINFKKLQWDLKAPSHLSVGEPGTVEIKLVNRKQMFPSIALCCYLQHGMATKETAVYMQTALNPGETCNLKSMVTPRKRGLLELRLSGVGSRFPFGFLQRTVHSNLNSSVIVWPARVSYTFHGFAGGQHVAGRHSKNRPGQGSDLLKIRPYERGDAPRFVHWKATARSGKLIIRQLAQECESGYHLYVDPAASEWTEESFEQLCSLVRSLAEDLFYHGQLETVKLGDAALLSLRTVSDLHAHLDALALLERRNPEVESLIKGFEQANYLTFSPMGTQGVAIYQEGNYAGQIDD